MIDANLLKLVRVGRFAAFSVAFLLAAFLFPADAVAACGDPGASPCSCGWGGLGRCCDYDYLPLVGECSDASGFPTFCGGTDEPRCKLTEPLRACKSGRVNVSGTCRKLDGDGYPTSCGGTNESACSLTLQIALGISACKSGLTEIPFTGGTCRRLDSDGFPSFCGGEGERPCLITEHIPSCKSGLDEVPFPGGDCTRPDADGFPPFCGGSGERACYINEHIPSCKSNLIEVEGSCDSLDSDGWPTLCGGQGEPACTLDVQLILGVSNCKDGTVAGREIREVPAGNGTCTLLDEDGFPPFCGDDQERPCNILENIPSCKDHVEESQGICQDTYPTACGRNGQRPCTILEKLIPCKRGLSERDHDFGECGADPEDWPSTEVPRGGRRSVFLLHGRNGDIEDLQTAAAGIPGLAKFIKSSVPNAVHVYGVDWNSGTDAARKLAIRELNQTGPDTWSVANTEFGSLEWNGSSFRVYRVAQALAEAVKTMPTEENITIITHSFGGVVGRHLVYRHYDELRKAGKTIAEVITIAAPHAGGGMSAPVVPGGTVAQDTMACLTAEFDITSMGGAEEWHNVCELGRWHEFRQRREDGILGPPFGSWHIDDRDYPQIRWVVVAENGYRLDVADGISIDPASLPSFLQGAAEDFLLLKDGLDYYDSDHIILTASQLGLEFDECFPFTRTPGPEGQSIEVSEIFRNNVDGQSVLSAQCHHPGARVDSRYTEIEDLVLDHVANDDRIKNFILSVLNLEGDTNGDGRVDDADLTAIARAGNDVEAECTGSSTEVRVDGGESADPAGGGLTYSWYGDFGQESGASPTLLLPVGTQSVTLEIEDSLGRSSSDQVVVTVRDTTAPELVVDVRVTVEATSVDGASHEVTYQSATDLCGSVDVQLGPAPQVFPLGETVVTLIATDESGNLIEQSIVIDVVDTTPPEMIAPPAVSLEATAVLTPVAIGVAEATDIFPVTVTSDAPEDGFPLGETVVTWTGVDANGNEATAIQTVMVDDTTPPQITQPAGVQVEATSVLTPVLLPEPSATDIFAVVVAGDAPEAGFPLGDTVVTWKATDTHGNESTATQTVTVVDTTPPQLTQPANVAAEATALFTPVTLAQPTATDIFQVNVTSDAPGSGYGLGDTVVTWTATDSSGNETTVAQTVTIVDTTPPALTIPGAVSVIASGPLTAISVGTASATDIFEPVEITNDVPAQGFAPGRTEVIWTATDANGNSTTLSQEVHVSYQFSGLLDPVTHGGVYKASRTLPIKFALSFSDGALATESVAQLQVSLVGPDSTTGEAVDVSADGTADAGNLFRFTDDHYQFNLGTQGMAPGTYRLTIQLDDDNHYSADLTLK
jgi:hypothetical protein